MRRLLLFTAVLTVSFVLAFSGPYSAVSAQTDSEEAVVVNVVDGDTIDVRILGGGDTFRVRYIGMNTAERGETCYSEGTAANRALVDGQTILMLRDVSETDRYGRLLRYVFVGDTFVNAELVRLGVAEAVEYPPDTAQATLLNQLETQASAAGRGCINSGLSGSTTTENTSTLYVTGNNINVRSCAQTDCRVVTTMTRGTAVNALGTVTGASVSGNTSWYEVRLQDGSTAYIHSSLLGDNRPVVQPTSRPLGQPTARPAGSSGPAVSTPIPQPISTPVPAGPGYACNCSRTCTQMTCDEAYFQLNTCGCGRRDGDGDGVPCENVCPGG